MGPVVPDFVDAAVIDTTRDELGGGGISGGARFMVRTRATGRDGACNCDGRSC